VDCETGRNISYSCRHRPRYTEMRSVGRDRSGSDRPRLVFRLGVRYATCQSQECLSLDQERVVAERVSSSQSEDGLENRSRRARYSPVADRLQLVVECHLHDEVPAREGRATGPRIGTVLPQATTPRTPAIASMGLNKLGLKPMTTRWVNRSAQVTNPLFERLICGRLAQSAQTRPRSGFFSLPAKVIATPPAAQPSHDAEGHLQRTIGSRCDRRASGMMRRR
jgi:hypothetical protein